MTGTSQTVSATVHNPLILMILLLAPLDGAVHDVQLLAGEPQRLQQLRVRGAGPRVLEAGARPGRRRRAAATARRRP